MKHTYQDHNFQHRVVPPGLSDLLTNSRFRRFDVGQLVKLLSNHLLHSPKLRSVRQLFGLLNFTDTFTKFSHGYSGVPPRSVWPAHNCQIYTFALTGEDYDLLGTERTQIGMHLSHNLVVWGYTDIQFVSIGLTSVECFNLGLTSVLHFDAEYLYNIVGCLTKNLVKFNDLDWYSTSDEVYKQVGLEDAARQFTNRPVNNLFETVPYKFWVFSKRLWRTMPSVFVSNMVVASTVEFYFRHCNDAWRFIPTDDASRGPIFGLLNTHIGIIGVLRESLLTFLQNVKNHTEEFQDAADYIAPLVLLAMVERRTNKITGSNEDAARAIQIFEEEAVTWNTLLSNPDSTARRMFMNDTRLADALLGIVDIDGDDTNTLDIVGT